MGLIGAGLTPVADPGPCRAGGAVHRGAVVKGISLDRLQAVH